MSKTFKSDFDRECLKCKKTIPKGENCHYDVKTSYKEADTLWCDSCHKKQSGGKTNEVS